MNYDVVIVGSGVAGLTAAIYAARAGKSAIILENSIIGGTTATLESIENYPGFVGKSGADLINIMIGQVMQLSVPIEMQNIDHIDYDNKTIIFTDGQKYGYKALILSTGTSYIPLNVKGEERLKFRGISYCATCDGRLYKDKKIVVVTNGAKGADSIDYLNNLASELIVLDITNLYKNDKLTVYNNVSVLEVIGTDYVEGIEFVSDNKNMSLDCAAAFVCLGKNSDTRLFDGKITLNNNKVITDDSMRTNIESVFAAGDIRDKKLRQIITACADGAIAATEAVKYISSIEK